MSDDIGRAVRAALMMLRDHARQRLVSYATRHRMRATGWHFMIDASSAASARVSESGLVIMRTVGARYFAIRVTVTSDGLDNLPDAAALEILKLDEDRVSHLIFSRDGWTETRAVKKQSDTIVENAIPAPDQLDKK